MFIGCSSNKLIVV